MHPQHILATLALALPALASASSPAYTKLGCYSIVPDVKGDSTSPFQSLGMCVTQCAKDNYKIAVLSKGDHCACSNALPPDSSKVDDDKCNTVCPGYPVENCGGDNAYSVLSTGQAAAGSGSGSGSDGGASVTPTAATAAGGIVVAATNLTPSTVPTSILTAPGTMTSKAGAASSSAGAAVTAASSSASVSPTANAAGSMRSGSSLAGVLVAGLGLLL